MRGGAATALPVAASGMIWFALSIPHQLTQAVVPSLAGKFYDVPWIGRTGMTRN